MQRWNGLRYLYHHAQEIDVLHLTHVQSTDNYYWLWLYKKLNPNGKAYLRLDTHYGILDENPLGPPPLKYLRNNILKKYTVISAETESTADGLCKAWGVNVSHINNGFYQHQKQTVSYAEKDNVICTVGRIGTKQKATDILLKAFRVFAQQNKVWQLRIIGKIEPSFKPFIRQFLHDNPALRNRITFTGEINDRECLYKEYRKAKIFCLSSRWEGFSVACMEAMSAGCYIIHANTYSAYDVTNYGKYGVIFPVEDYIGLAKCFLRICNDETLLRENCPQVQEYVTANYTWPAQCQKLNSLLFKGESVR